MRLLHASVDTTVIALWLGHESVATTQINVHADLALKERAWPAPPRSPPFQAATNPPTQSWPSSTTVISPVFGYRISIGKDQCPNAVQQIPQRPPFPQADDQRSARVCEIWCIAGDPPVTIATAGGEHSTIAKPIQPGDLLVRDQKLDSFTFIFDKAVLPIPRLVINANYAVADPSTPHILRASGVPETTRPYKYYDKTKGTNRYKTYHDPRVSPDPPGRGHYLPDRT
jgi:hypothetical protein